MSSNYTQIASYFLKLSEHVLNQSITRKVLNDKIEFSPTSLFKFISQEKNAISAQDIIEFLNSIGEQMDILTATKIIDSLALSGSGKLALKDFLSFVCESKYICQSSTRLMNQKPTPPIKFLVAKLLLNEKSIVSLVDTYKSIFSTLPPLSIYSLYYSINDDKRKSITDTQMSDFMHVHLGKQFISASSVHALLSRLDRDKDGLVGYIDFNDSIKCLNIPQSNEEHYHIHSKYSSIPKYQTPNKKSALEIVEVSPIKSEAQALKKENTIDQIRKDLDYEVVPIKFASLFSTNTQQLLKKLTINIINHGNEESLKNKEQLLSSLLEAKKAVDNSFEKIQTKLSTDMDNANKVGDEEPIKAEN